MTLGDASVAVRTGACAGLLVGGALILAGFPDMAAPATRDAMAGAALPPDPPAVPPDAPAVPPEASAVLETVTSQTTSSTAPPESSTTTTSTAPKRTSASTAPPATSTTVDTPSEERTEEMTAPSVHRPSSDATGRSDAPAASPPATPSPFTSPAMTGSTPSTVRRHASGKAGAERSPPSERDGLRETHPGEELGAPNESDGGRSSLFWPTAGLALALAASAGISGVVLARVQAGNAVPRILSSRGNKPLGMKVTTDSAGPSWSGRQCLQRRADQALRAGYHRRTQL